MELCTATATALPKIFTSNSMLLSNSSLTLQIPRSILLHRRSNLHSRSVQFSRLVPRATFEEKPSGGASSYASAAAATEEPESSVVVEAEKKVYTGSLVSEEPPKEDDSPVDGQVNEFLDNLNLKFDTEDTYSLLLYGVGALAALWLASAVVSAIDSIPLFPKLMEVVGLGYSFWFTTRYLLFKENRDELAAKVEELKKQVLGSE